MDLRLVISFLFLGALSLSAQPQETLAPGRPIVAELTGTQTHSYRMNLESGQYARILLEQRGVDVFLRVRAPGAKDGVEFDSELLPTGSETAEFTTDEAGSYTLDVEGKFRGLPKGTYSLEIAEIREANDRDRRLYTARRLRTEALRLRAGGRPADAQRLAEQALEIRQRELGADHLATADSAQLLGRLAQDQGDYDRAQQLLERALRIREAALPRDHPEIGMSLNNVAVVHRFKEDFGRAALLQRRALAIVEKSLGPQHPATAVVLINLGVVCNLVGDSLKAEEAYRRVMAILEKTVGPDDRNVAVVANNLGITYRDRGDYTAAEPFFQRALSIFEKTLGPEHVALREPVMNLAVVNTYSGNHSAAEQFYERALALTKRSVGENHPTVATILNNYAESQRASGNYTRAEELALRALSIREGAFGDDHPGVGRVLNTLALLYDAMGDTARAVETQERSWKISERVLALNLAAGSERQKLAYAAGTADGGWLLDQTNHILSMAGRPGAPSQAHELAARVLLQRKGRVQDALSESLGAMRRRFSVEDRGTLERWNETNSQLSKLVLGGPGERSLADYKRSIAALEQRREELEDVLSRKGADAFLSLRPAALTAMRDSLPEHAALIEFAVYQPMDPRFVKHDQRLGAARYAAFVLRRDWPLRLTDLGAAAEIDGAVAALRDALRDTKRQDYRERARALYDKVMTPLRTSLDDVSQLLVSPDGTLNLIPFAALVDEQGAYLVERLPITYLTSGRDLLRFTTQRPAPNARQALILADPAFGEPEEARVAAVRQKRTERRRSINTGSDISTVYFVPLPATAREAQAIGGLFPGSVVLTGAAAAESALKRADAPPVLHVATHGFFLDDHGASGSSAGGKDRRGVTAGAEIENPLLRAGLVLAGANRSAASGEDGILTALEASGLNLRGTKLVTLSACDTGVGEVRNGEGVYGFRRALMLAGAESLVMSLWPVSDQVTRELMTEYYTRLKHGEGRGEALRQVQLQMIRSSSRRRPFYWASFIQSGEWANLEGRR